MRNKRVCSIITLLAFMVSNFVVFNKPAFADTNQNSEYITINRSINGTEFEVGEKINVNYTITPETLAYSQQTNEKDIVLVMDTSGSMKERIRNNNGNGNAYENLSKSKLEIVKEVSKEFVDKFKNNDKVNLNIIGYSSKTNFIYNGANINQDIDVSKDNIAEMCDLLDINKSNIYYKYNYIHYQINGTTYWYDKRKNDQYYYRLDLNKYPNVDELDFYYYDYDSGNLTKIENIYDIILANMKADGSTNIGDALRRGYYLLNNNNGHDKYIVMLTDGQAEAYSTNWNDQFKMDDGGAEKSYITYWSNNHKYANPDYRSQSLEYAKKVASEKLKDSGVKTFFIGFGNGASEDGAAAKNLQIAQSAGGNYYDALNEHEINSIYDEIGKIIEANKSAKIHFEEQIPEGVTISQQDIDKLPKGLRVEGNKIIGDLEEKVFYEQVKGEKGNVTGLRADPVNFNITYTANKAKDNCTFGQNSTSFVRYTLDDGKEITRKFNPSTIKIKQNIQRSLLSVDRIIDTAKFQEETFDVKYRIVPERIKNNNISSNNDKKEVVLVLDTSGSMDWDIDGNETNREYNKRISIMKNTAIDFINKISQDKNVKVGLVQYDSKIVNSQSVSNGSKDNLIKAIESMTAKGGTNIGEGLRDAYHMLHNSNGKDKYIVLMSDGFPTAFTAEKNKTNYVRSGGGEVSKGEIIKNNGKDHFKSLISTQFITDANSQNVEYVMNYGDKDEKEFSLQYAKKMGSVIKDSNKDIKTFVIGFSNGANSEKLQQIVGSAEGKYYRALDEKAMENVYDSIQQIVKANISANAHFQETIDGNIEIVNPDQLPYGLHLENGKLIGDINNIYYTLSEDGSYYEAEPIEFTVTYKPGTNSSIRFGENNSSFVNYITSIGKTERVNFQPLELSSPKVPVITQEDTLYNGKAKVSITGEAGSTIEYKIQGETKWSVYTKELYLNPGTTIYSRCRRLCFLSDEASFITYNTNSQAISTFTRNLPDKIALGSQYEIRYRFDGDSVRYNVEKPVEIVLILNTSMTMKDHSDKLKEAAISFIDNMPKNKDIKVGVVKYYGFGEVVSNLVDIRNINELSGLKSEINKIKNEGGTNLGDTLRLGYQLLNNGSNADKHFVIMSDGYANVGIIKADGSYSSGWENETYVNNLDSSINNNIRKEIGYTRFGLQGKTNYSGTDTNRDGLLDRFNIGHKYVTTIANAINESNININSHVIHFKRVDGAGDDVGARKNNNEVATILGVTKEVKPGQKFYLAENSDELQMAFNNVAGVIQDSISFEKVEFSETFPQGVEVVEYPNGLTYNKSTNTLSGSIRNIKMNNINENMNLYKVDGEFAVKVKFNELGEKVFNKGEINYIEPFDDDEKNIRCNSGSVYVLDDSKLSIKQTSIVSNNSNNNSRAKVGDVITISIEASKDVYKPVVTVAGNSADDIVKVGSSEKEWKAYYTMKEDDIEGKINFNIQLKDKYLDNTINAADTTDGSQVIFDKTPPRGSIEYSTQELTNGNVTATIKKQGEDLEVINNNGSRSYEFKENGSYTFRFKDETGNNGEATAVVTWIDKVGPEASITYDINTLTNKNVVATLVPDEDIIITNNNGKSIYTFTENREFTFEFKDKAGNTASKTANVDWIDREVPHVHIEYSTTELTNSDVIAILVADEDEDEEFFATNNNKEKKCKFTQNGSFKFEYTDKAGNTGSVTAKVDWIDKEAPSGYSVNIDEQTVNQINKSNFTFTINAAEVNTIYNYTITSSSGGEAITGTGTVISEKKDDIITDFKIAGVDISKLKDGTLTVKATLTDLAGNVGNEESDTAKNNSQAILKQGIYINKGIKEISSVNIIKNMPTDLGALIKLSAVDPTITVSFDKKIKPVKFKLIDKDGNLVGSSTSSVQNTNQYKIKTTKPLDGEYIIVYRVIAQTPDETINIKINLNGTVEDTMKANVIDLPKLD